MKTAILTLSTTVLLLGTAGIALAQQPGSRAPDSDGDGLVSLAEAKAGAARRFARMDANSDGQIDKADREARMAQRFAATDTDDNGELSPAEMQAAQSARQAQRAERRAQREAARFARLDTDGSGGLSEDELRAAHAERGEKRGEARGERRGPPQEMHAEPRGGHHGQHPRGGMMLLRAADANRDMTVTRAEFDAAVEARFARVDTDQSGTISAAERKAAREAMRSERGPKRGPKRGRGGEGGGEGAL